MTTEQYHIFASYARQDAQTVHRLVQALRDEYRLRELPVDVWIDVDDLRPGEQWAQRIAAALRRSIGLLVFVSPESMRSEWIRRELEVAAEQPDRLIIPIVLQHVPGLPTFLARRQWVDLSEGTNRSRLRQAIQAIVDATEHHIRTQSIRPAVSEVEAATVGAELATAARGDRPATRAPSPTPASAFIVHGHDERSLNEVEAYIRSVGVEPVVLRKIGGAAQSLFQRFLEWSTDTRFAIVILSADDFGVSRVQYEATGVGERALQFRARQNVILELGFFYGHLGWENVFVLYRPPDQVFPNFERPSDLEGVVFDSIDAEGRWRVLLRDKLAGAGFQIESA